MFNYMQYIKWNKREIYIYIQHANADSIKYS